MFINISLVADIEKVLDKIETNTIYLLPNNKNIILEKVTCDCGCIITKKYLTKHKKTKTYKLLYFWSLPY